MNKRTLLIISAVIISVIALLIVFRPNQKGKDDPYYTRDQITGIESYVDPKQAAETQTVFVITNGEVLSRTSPSAYGRIIEQLTAYLENKTGRTDLVGTIVDNNVSQTPDSYLHFSVDVANPYMRLTIRVLPNDREGAGEMEIE